MERKPVIFIDLEDTVINNWHDGQLLTHGVYKIQQILEKEYPRVTDLNIWSYAIWNNDDLDRFNKIYRKWLEEVFGMNIDLVFSVHQIRNLIYSYEHIEYEDRNEFMQMNGKFLSFMKYGQLYKDRDFVLFDDLVPNSLLTFHDLNTTIRTIKI